jgi:flavin reductase (DIM6/NTAB) family NADH-FMN oxidoreductase RutF
VTIDTSDFRRAVGRYATGVTVITTKLDGADHAMTANSFTSVSLEPLLVLFCTERESRFHEAVLDTGQWGVSVLALNGRRHAQWFATPGRPLIGQFTNAPHHRGETGVLLLDDAIAWLECTTVDVHRAGDHDIVVGAVSVLHDLPELGDPLVYWASRYCTAT